MSNFLWIITRYKRDPVYLSVADTWFPRGVGANSPGGGAPTYEFVEFSQKLHEIERIWTPGGRGSPAPPP